MLNKAIKELMSENGTQASVLCVAMGQSESTFSRMYMKDDSTPKSDSLELLARRLNIKVSDIWLKAESLAPVMCRYFYSERQALQTGSNMQVYINGNWRTYTECTTITGSSSFEDVIYIGEAKEWDVKLNGKVQCPDLYKQLCDEAKEKQSTKQLPNG